MAYCHVSLCIEVRISFVSNAARAHACAIQCIARIGVYQLCIDVVSREGSSDTIYYVVSYEYQKCITRNCRERMVRCFGYIILSKCSKYGVLEYIIYVSILYSSAGSSLISIRNIIVYSACIV